MADYQKAAAELKARLDAKERRRVNFDAFYEALKSGLAKQVALANEALIEAGAPIVVVQMAYQGQPTDEPIAMKCGKAAGKISQDRNVPSVAEVITGEAGEKTVTFLVLAHEEPVVAQRVSLAPAVEAKLSVDDVAANFVEELIAGAP